LRAAAQVYRQRPLLHRWQVSDGHNHPHGPPDFQHPRYYDDAHVRDLHGDHPGHDHAHEKPEAAPKKAGGKKAKSKR
jgi:hypothetical protein